MLIVAGFALAPPATAAGPSTERVGIWIITPGPPSLGAGCSMASGGARGRLLVMLDGGDTRMEASSKSWFASGSLSYPARLTIDADAPFDVMAQGAGPDGLHIVPAAKLATAAFVERLKTGGSLAIRKDSNPLVETVTFDLSGFGAAYARLQACAAESAARANAAAAVSNQRCDRLADAAAAAVGGKRGAREDGEIAVTGSGDAITVSCGAPGDRPTISLVRDGSGIPAGTSGTVDKLAGALAGQPATAFADLSSRCFGHAVRYEIRHGGKRVYRPAGAVAQREGELRVGTVKLTCQSYEPGQVQPSFSFEER